MKFMEFDYTKADGTTKPRELLVLSEPSQVYFGIDVSELNSDEFSILVESMRKLKNEYDAKTAELMNDFEVRTMLRNFKPENMANTTVEWL
jgi:hypothetical protein